MRHELKIGQNYLDNLLSGKKKMEIRFNDRDYQVGDSVCFWDGNESVSFLITHIHSGLGMKDGYVVLSVERVRP